MMTGVLRKTTGLCSILILSCWSMTMALENQLIRFPGDKSQITSPDGKNVLINIDSTSKEQALSLGGNHALYLRNLKTGKQERIFSYDRYVEVLWSPKGNKLMVNDYAGSDYSIPIILSFGSKEKPIDVEEQLRIKMRENRTIFGNHHVYIVGTEWLNENKIRLKIYGYGDVDPDGFTLWYEYTLGDDFEFIKREPFEKK